MKNKNRFSFLLITGAAFISMAMSSPAFDIPTQGPAVVSDAFLANQSVTNGQTLTVGSNAVAVRAGQGLGLWTYSLATNTTTADNVFKLRVTRDGTTYAPLLNITNQLNSTTAVWKYTPLPAAQIEGVKFIEWYQVVNGHTNTITSGLSWSRSLR